MPIKTSSTDSPVTELHQIIEIHDICLARLHESMALFSSLDHFRHWLRQLKHSEKTKSMCRKWLDRFNNLEIDIKGLQTRNYRRAKSKQDYFTMVLDSKDLAEFRVLADKRSTTISKLIREAMHDYLQKTEGIAEKS